jgi:ribosomal small subunit protein bTHX
MGKGDKKSRRGKIILGTYGVRRPRKTTIIPPAKVKPAEEDLKGARTRDRKIQPVEEPRTTRATRPAKPAAREKAEVTEKNEKDTKPHTRARKEKKPEK